MLWKNSRSPCWRSPAAKASISPGAGIRGFQVRGLVLKICTTSAPMSTARCGTGVNPPAEESWAPIGGRSPVLLVSVPLITCLPCRSALITRRIHTEKDIESRRRFELRSAAAWTARRGKLDREGR